MMTAAEFTLCCHNAGLSAQEIDEWNIGTIIDYIDLRNEAIRRRNSDSAYTDEERKQSLRDLVPQVEAQYRAGKISREKYERFMKSLPKE